MTEPERDLLAIRTDRPLSDDQVAEFRERLEAALANPRAYVILPREVTDTERIEAAVAVLERRYPGTRPEALQSVLGELRFIARNWRRQSERGRR